MNTEYSLVAAQQTELLARDESLREKVNDHELLASLFLVAKAASCGLMSET